MTAQELKVILDYHGALMQDHATAKAFQDFVTGEAVEACSTGHGGHRWLAGLVESIPA